MSWIVTILAIVKWTAIVAALLLMAALGVMGLLIAAVLLDHLRSKK
jgi:hypothetical protein